MNPGCRVQDQLNTSEPKKTVYVKPEKLISERAEQSGNRTPDPLHERPVV